MNQTQKAFNELGGHVTPFSGSVANYLRGLHLAPESQRAAAVLGQEVNRQAVFIGMIDAFYMMALMLLVCVPLLALVKKGVGRETSELDALGEM